MYCAETGGSSIYSYTNPSTSGSLASFPPTTASSSPARSSRSPTTPTSTNVRPASASTTTTSQTNSTGQAAQSSPSLSTGAIAGIVVGSFAAGFGALALCFVFLLLPLFKKRKGQDHHPRGTLGGAILPGSGSNSEHGEKMQEELRASLGPAGVDPNSGVGQRDGIRLVTPGAPMKQKQMPWGPSSYSIVQRQSELDDTSFQHRRPELDSLPEPSSGSGRAHMASAQGSPYKAPNLGTPSEAAVELDNDNEGLPTILRARGFPYGNRRLSASSVTVMSEPSVADQVPGRAHQRESSQSRGASSLNPQQDRPESGFVSPLTSSSPPSGPQSGSFEPTPPSHQATFNSTQTRTEPQGLGLSQHQQLYPERRSSRPISDIRPPSSIYYDEHESPLPASLQVPAAAGSARSSGPGRPSARYTYENPLPQQPKTTITDSPPTSRPATAPNAEGNRPGNTYLSSEIVPKEERSSTGIVGSSRPATGVGIEADERPSATGSWQGYVSPENALRDGFWEGERGRHVEGR